MKIFKWFGHEKALDSSGSILVIVLILSALMLILGAAALAITNIGYGSLSAERQYHQAYWFAEDGLMALVQNVLYSSSVPLSANYSTNKIYDSTGNFAFISTKGLYASAKVLKTAVIPTSPGIGALTVANNVMQFTISGSAVVQNCNCGSGLVYGGSLTQNITGSYLPPNNCTGTNNKGLIGDPPSQNRKVNVATAIFNAPGGIFNSGNPSDPSTVVGRLGSDNNIPFDINGAPTMPAGLPSSCQNTGPCNMQSVSVTTGTGKNRTTTSYPKCGNIDFSVTPCNQIAIDGNVTIDSSSPNLSNLTIVSTGQITITDKSTVANITNVNFFGKTMDVQNSDIEGGLLYAQSILLEPATGNNTIGSTTNPTLVLANGGGLSDIAAAGTNDIIGLVFFNNDAATVGTIHGTVNVTGAVAINNTGANQDFSLDVQGNSKISYDVNVVNQLAKKLNGLMKTQACITATDALINTKITQY
jgi:hypothetical protein